MKKTKLFEQYQRIRKPMIAIVLGMAIIGRLIPHPDFQYAALSLLAAFLLQLLFEIHAKIDTPRTQPPRFDNVGAATDEMKRCLREGIKHGNGDVHIQWIGMTMFNAWNALSLILDWLDEDLHVPIVKVEIAMLDDQWLEKKLDQSCMETRPGAFHGNQHHDPYDP